MLTINHEQRYSKKKVFTKCRVKLQYNKPFINILKKKPTQTRIRLYIIIHFPQVIEFRFEIFHQLISILTPSTYLFLILTTEMCDTINIILYYILSNKNFSITRPPTWGIFIAPLTRCKCYLFIIVQTSLLILSRCRYK